MALADSRGVNDVILIDVMGVFVKPEGLGISIRGYTGNHASLFLFHKIFLHNRMSTAALVPAMMEVELVGATARR